MSCGGDTAIFVPITEMYKLLMADEQISDIHVSTM